MTTVKVAITMPKELVQEVDAARKTEPISRSGYITRLVQKAIRVEKQARLKAAYDKIFSDPEIVEEQKNSTALFDNTGNDKGQEW
ncbi:MAG: hypothetical protein U9R57_04355 [Thermodesulfobacteriota bacterium]|nr:hypothetical protein [Thermodesulfobacteriota bacterium]